MLQKTIAFGCFICLTTLASAEALAQRSTGGNTARGGNTSSGLFGSRTIGGNLQPGSNSLFGGGTRGSSVGGSATTQQVQAGTVTGSERFINANRDATQSFVGVDTSEVRNIGGVGAGAANQGLGNAFNQFRQFDQFRQQFNNFNNAGQNARTQVRVGLTLGFEPPVATTTPFSGEVAQRLTRLPGVNLVGTPQVTFEGRTAVIRGAVASARDREMVSRLVLLEPGISAVRNEMTIASGSADPGSRPNLPPAAGQFAPPPAPPQS